MIAGIDLSTRAIDLILLAEDTDQAIWHHYPLTGQDAFDRARAVRGAMPGPGNEIWDDVLAVGIEQPRGHHGTVHIARVQGAVLACLPRPVLIQPWNPSSWRAAVGLPGNAPKEDVLVHVARLVSFDGEDHAPQDAFDAAAIALATRNLIERVAA